MEASYNHVAQANTILLVDDNPADRELFCELIQAGHRLPEFNILQAESCEAALALVERHQLVCCLVDYHLPADNGLDFLKAVRRMEFGESIPVIIMTGGEDERLGVEMMRNGAQDYLVKNDISSQSLQHSILNAMHTCELQSKLRHLAHYDNLTGLLNRSLFMDRLQTVVGQCDRYDHRCSLFFVDIDNFKQVNDQYGHETGDALLKAVGERIKQSCRATDSAARLGGDEFAILLVQIEHSDSSAAANNILEKVSEPIVLESHNLQVSLSIGIAHYPGAANSTHDLLRQADEAMYRAKRAGKDRFFQFTEDQKLQWERRNALEKALPVALSNNELTLAFQPIVSTKDESLHSLEVLVRWFPTGYDVAAIEIIEMVDRLGLFDPFHVWLINASLKQLSEWQKDCPELRLCLNIPVSQCHSQSIVSYLHQSMEDYDVKAEQIELEVSETALMKRPEVSAQLFQSVQREGVRIAIDNFGIGYSSMSCLTTLPLNTLKIDQRFLVDIDSNSPHRKVVEAITALGHSLGFNVVAGGVETVEQYRIAKAIGCDFIQGIYFGKPQLALACWSDFARHFPLLPSLLSNSEGKG